MTLASTAHPLSATYPTARVRGRAITRMEEKSLGWQTLDAATADDLGRQHCGWFVGGQPGLRAVVTQFARLDTIPAGGVWVVVPVSKELTAELWTLWPHRDHLTEVPTDDAPRWRSRRVWVATPESLRHYLPALKEHPEGVAGVLLLDPVCIMHRARGGTDWRGRTIHNDRPQHVVNFRAALDVDGWQPPLCLFTEKLAKAVDPTVIARHYCLEGFRFIAGDTFVCCVEPIEPDDASNDHSR